MSSQFSYELDERQIRILMQNGQLEYNELAWNRFEAASGRHTIKELKPRASAGFNFSISRSIIVPVLFVGMIGGLSVLLFSFVDFKKKEETIKEIPLVPNPGKAPKTSTIKPAPVQLKPKVAVIATPAVKTETVASQPVSTPTVAITANTTVTKPTEVASKPAAQPVVTQQNQNTTQLSQHTIPQTNHAAPVQVKKKKKKVNYEELPSISPSANLTTESVPDLKLN